jgi:hypothetical protein
MLPPFPDLPFSELPFADLANECHPGEESREPRPSQDQALADPELRADDSPPMLP